MQRTTQRGDIGAVRSLVYLGAVTGLVLCFRLGAKDFWEASEGRTAQAAREILDTGHWLIPTINGRPYTAKPPAYHWLVALTFGLTGHQGELTARVPAVLAGLATVLMTAVLATRAAGPRAGLLAGLLLLAMPKFLWQSRLSELEALLGLWTVLCYWSYWRAIQHPHGAWRYVLLFHLFFGLGGLTKGPAIVILVGMPLTAYALVERGWQREQWRRLKLTPVLALMPLGLALAVSWYAYVWWATPAASGSAMGPLAAQSGKHVRDPFFYLYTLPLLIGPVLALVPLLTAQWRAEEDLQHRRFRNYLACWVVVPLVFFSAFPSKQSHHLVPVLPALAVALAVAVQRFPERAVRWLGTFAYVVAAAAPVAWLAWWLAEAPPVGLSDQAYNGGLMVVTVCVGALLAWCTRRYGARAGFGLALNVWLIGGMLALGYLVPRQDVRESPKPLCAALSQVLPEQATLGILDDDPESNPEWVFYLRRPIVPLQNPEQVKQFLHQGPDHYMLISPILSERCVPAGCPLLDTFEDCTAPGESLHLFAGRARDLPPTR